MMNEELRKKLQNEIDYFVRVAGSNRIDQIGDSSYRLHSIMYEAVAAERERIRSEEWIAFMQQLEAFPHQDEDECLALGRIRAWMLNVPDTNNAINQEGA